MAKRIAIAAGLLCAVFAELVALFMTGSGHGWIAPFFYSMILFVAYPLVFVRLIDKTRTPDSIDNKMFLVAIWADILLVVGTVFLEFSAFRDVLESVPERVGLWITLWLLWQVPVVILRWNKGA